MKFQMAIGSIYIRIIVMASLELRATHLSYKVDILLRPRLVTTAKFFCFDPPLLIFANDIVLRTFGLFNHHWTVHYVISHKRNLYMNVRSIEALSIDYSIGNYCKDQVGTKQHCRLLGLAAKLCWDATILIN